MATQSPRPLGVPDPAFVWQASSIACVATFNVLEHDDKMDEFEDVDTPFDKAGKLKMKALRFWPGVSPPPGGLELVAQLKSREFLGLVAKNFSPFKRDPSLTSAAMLRDAAALFATADATLKDLAALVDARFAFPTSNRSAQ
jgi:hypothetical protein